MTLVNWDWDYEDAKESTAHEVTLHVAFVHAFVNPALLMVLHRGIRQVIIPKIDLEMLIYYDLSRAYQVHFNQVRIKSISRAYQVHIKCILSACQLNLYRMHC